MKAAVSASVHPPPVVAQPEVTTTRASDAKTGAIGTQLIWESLERSRIIAKPAADGCALSSALAGTTFALHRARIERPLIAATRRIRSISITRIIVLHEEQLRSSLFLMVSGTPWGLLLNSPA
ncbi:hypothetical protein [Rhizobium sp. BK176]|uniref:hypothetical protein n=1 Tax=Rhizobium sp. BK176 TaxID=2587071 RepID=UPI0021674F40|nr:hypothetical protein [Rhizobium sp. BK176]